MSSCYRDDALLYAVVPVDAQVPEGLDALHGARAAVIHAEQEVGRTDGPRGRRRFGRTIERIARDGPVLPMQFGAAVADLEELRVLIAEHEEAWAARLEAVAGCCELIVHLVHPHRRSRGWSGRQASRPTTPSGTSSGRC